MKYSDDSERLYSNYFSERYGKHLPYVQACSLLICSVVCITNFLNKSPSIVSIPSLLLIFVLPILLKYCLKPPITHTNLTKKQRFWVSFKEKIALCIWSALLILQYSRLFTNERRNAYLYFATGLDFTCMMLIIQSVFSKWHVHTTLITIICAYLTFMFWTTTDGYTNTNEAVEVTIRFVVIIITVSIVQYLMQKNIKELFHIKTKLESKGIVYNQILNQIPESILIVNADFELKYFNDCFKKNMLNNDEESLTIDNILSRFVDVVEYKLDCDSTSPNETIEPRNLKQILEQTSFDTKKIEDMLKSKSADQILTTRKLGFSIINEVSTECQMYTARHTKNSKDRSSSECVEIKISPITFASESSLLIIVRQAPELDLLKKLDQAAKYKDEVLASVSHELRTPINSNINLVYEALKSSEIPDHVKCDLLDPAYKSGKLLLHIVNDILDLSQIKACKLRLVSQVCELRKIIHDCHYLFEKQCQQKGIGLGVRISNCVPAKIRTDPNRLSQIILNLLSNAYKFTFEGGISINVGLAHEGIIRVSVCDTGIGIAEEDQKKLMKKFTKIDLGEKVTSNSTGAGLGLSIADSLARMLGPKSEKLGGLKFESVVGKGTTVEFLLRSKSSFTSVPQLMCTATSTVEAVRNSSSHGIAESSNTEDAYEDEGSSEYIEEDKEHLSFPVHSFKESTETDEIYMDRKPELMQEESNKSIKSIVLQTRKHTKSLSPKIPLCTCPKVLIVDDDCFNVLTLKTMLTSLNILSESALSGVECLEKLKDALKCGSDCARFSIIIMDGNMPLKDGYETTKELLLWNKQQEDPWKITVVGCTAYCSKTKSEAFMHAGALEHISKPLNKSELSKIIKKYLNI